MAARRHVLSGASDREREDRQLLQRDYAAQLQEQIRLKNAKADEAKAQRLRDQQAEREQMDYERAATMTRPPPPSQNFALPPPASPVRSPVKPAIVIPAENDMPHATTLLNTSPTKSFAFQPSVGAAPTYQFHPGPALVSPFTPGPSIFESLLQPEQAILGRKTKFYGDVEALHALRAEVETTWRHRHVDAQNTFVKPCFVMTPPVSAASSIPLSSEDKRQLDDEIDLTPRLDESLESSSSGLIGESILIPLVKSQPRRPGGSAASSPSSSPHARKATFPVRQNDALRHDSELVHFASTLP
ncbi:hypothetical protein Poli38472_008397 [Pythium oligandrum]|uniref:Uncharacterized protein n=1 Tax=Pythium oligandrum TaxID=41045 RepID=A0A8K1CM12_PYTOL|nr:hypothetical protein Poli38472_008397 [Pythium oligandrum]|eukprot:TMW65755.1 hypothetical protein Poli38472_008397 [Pythium oligandrum]